ncbi:MAG: hypothetical protein WDN69_21545 [Aliidongia sp.]
MSRESASSSCHSLYCAPAGTTVSFRAKFRSVAGGQSFDERLALPPRSILIDDKQVYGCAEPIFDPGAASRANCLGRHTAAGDCTARHEIAGINVYSRMRDDHVRVTCWQIVVFVEVLVTALSCREGSRAEPGRQPLVEGQFHHDRRSHHCISFAENLTRPVDCLIDSAPTPAAEISINRTLLFSSFGAGTHPVRRNAWGGAHRLLARKLTEGMHRWPQASARGA